MKFILQIFSADQTCNDSRQENTNQRSTRATERSVALVPVHKDDFKKISEFAESAWICREPNQADTIRGTRRELLREVSEASVVGTLFPFKNLFNLIWDEQGISIFL